MERLNSGDKKVIFGTNLCTLNIGLVKSGRVQWQEAEETREDLNIVLIHQDKKFFISELFKVIQDAITLILNCRTMYYSEQILRVHLSYWMCGQFTLHHKFRIDSGRTKIGQGKTNSILYGCESYEQKNTEIQTQLTWKHRVLHGT